ncbi:MAG: penicillin-binding protein 2 [Candidatus Ryanbacteria bacterium CG10_big_fil_rev_8_21_14_0_10_43_42]|uniref:Penicillin-binding protein 2 n=1 Tax=Candidatus Ryanbacteria bacterium CG10_big_fil_rev_8_21_14_0_10_43_42 TaxID=1974864 RepID=A0A2M8KW06_9BACT|nr:MAG: penicillin-binding protein 2 [Candidatus Ryanbacteria bacterium CG10_big_fil_rev_8_21_14_0_10_43_42]
MNTPFLKTPIRKQFTVSPEEVFLDTQNLPGFDNNRFEGTIEHPIRHGLFIILGILFGAVGILLIARTGYLTLFNGNAFAVVSDRNHLRHRILVPERGIIYDRNLTPIAFNVPGFRVYIHMDGRTITEEDMLVQEIAKAVGSNTDELTHFINDHSKKDLFIDTIYDWDTANHIIALFRDDDRVTVDATTIRSYYDSPALSHIVGYMGRVNTSDIEKNETALDWGVIGRSGLEKTYDGMLRGTLGTRIIETNSEGRVLSEGIFQKAEEGKSIVLTISAELQNILYETIKETVEERGFTGGSAVALDVHTGEILGLVSYPGFDMNLLTKGIDVEAIAALFESERNPLFNRTVSGLYPPASTVKPFLAMAAIEEHIIRPEDSIVTEGQLVVPNPYDPDNPSIFKDWRNHGAIAMREAIAFSSNVYFYVVGGGFGNIEGLGRERIAQYFRLFGIGTKTNTGLPGETEGIIPDEAWKKERYPSDPTWRLGDTYNMSIGQGGVLVTPLQMARAVTTIARGGTSIEPQLLRGIITDKETKTVKYTLSPDINTVPLVSEEAVRVAHEGMEESARIGTASGLSGIPITVAGKTGTAELGKTGRVHSWFMGFAPADNPDMVLVINLENGSDKNLIGGTFVAREIWEWYATGGKEVIHGGTDAID